MCDCQPVCEGLCDDGFEEWSLKQEGLDEALSVTSYCTSLPGHEGRYRRHWRWVVEKMDPEKACEALFEATNDPQYEGPVNGRRCYHPAGKDSAWVPADLPVRSLSIGDAVIVQPYHNPQWAKRYDLTHEGWQLTEELSIVFCKL